MDPIEYLYRQRIEEIATNQGEPAAREECLETFAGLLRAKRSYLLMDQTQQAVYRVCKERLIGK